MIQLVVSMGPTCEALSKGELDSLRPFTQHGIVYARTRCDKSLMNLLGIDKLPILGRQTRLARLIMLEAHCEDHRSTATDVLARSQRRAWIVRGRQLAKEVC